MGLVVLVKLVRLMEIGDMRRIKLFTHDRPFVEKFLSFCPKCNSVEMKLKNGLIIMQRSIAHFPLLKSKECFACSKK